MIHLVYERTLHDHRTNLCYEIEGYIDDEGEFLHYTVFYGDEQQQFQDEDTMYEFLRTDIANRRAMKWNYARFLTVGMPDATESYAKMRLVEQNMPPPCENATFVTSTADHA